MRCLAPLLCMLAFTPAFTKELKNEEYGRAGGVSLRLDASIPEGKGPFPAAILVHGGGWIQGDRSHNVEPLFKPLNQAGFAWFSISYRLATDFYQFGVAAEDVEQAVRHVRENAARYNIDPQRIALVGESAGAHLASLAALNRPGSVAAVVALYSPSDLELLARTSAVVPAQIRSAIEGTIFADMLLGHLRSLSPVQKVTKDAPPFLLIHGTADSVVPYDQSVRMRERLVKAGVDCDLVTIDGGGHGLRYWERSSAHAAYRPKMIDWLRKRLG